MTKTNPSKNSDPDCSISICTKRKASNLGSSIKIKTSDGAVTDTAKHCYHGTREDLFGLIAFYALDDIIIETSSLTKKDICSIITFINDNFNDSTEISVGKPHLANTCLLDGCNKIPFGRGHCSMHYSRLLRHGSTDATRYKAGGHDLLPEYNSFRGMIRRTSDPTFEDYKHYGERGIRVCEQWLEKPDGFLNFLDDMGRRPSDKYPDGRAKYTLERINNDGDYEPNNCKWATAQEQNRNRRTLNNHTSGLKGISWHKKAQKWRVYIKLSGKQINIGLFFSLEQAIQARKNAEERLWA